MFRVTLLITVVFPIACSLGLAELVTASRLFFARDSQHLLSIRTSSHLVTNPSGAKLRHSCRWYT